jgi:hypothetical protein
MKKFSLGYKNRRDHLFLNILKECKGVRCHANENHYLCHLWKKTGQNEKDPLPPAPAYGGLPMGYAHLDGEHLSLLKELCHSSAIFSAHL